MIIHFCDKCGHRVPQSQIDNHSAVIQEEVRAICAGCSGRRTSRRSTGVQAVAPGDTTSRKSALNIVPASRSSATHKAPTAEHLSRASAHHTSSESSNKTLIYVGAGVVGLSIILGVVLLSSNTAERSTPPRDQGGNSTASGPSSSTPVPSPNSVTTSTSTSPTTVTPVATTPSSTTTPSTKPDDTYDPRGAVATSLLAQAKAQATSDPWASRTILEDLQRNYARTKAAEEAGRLLAEWKRPPQQTPPGQIKPRLDGSIDTDLLLTDAFTWRCGHTGRAREDLSIDGNPLRIGTKTFPKGIGFHSIGELKFDLGGHYKWLTGYLGVDGETNGAGSVGFEIFLDGRRSYESGVLRGSDEARYLKVPVDGVSLVQIAVSDGGDDQTNDHADLCALRVWVGPDEPQESSTPSVTPPPTTPTNVATTSPAVTQPPPEPPAQSIDPEAVGRQAYAEFLLGFWKVLGQKGWDLARSRLDAAQKDPTLASRSGELKGDRELLALVQKAWDAVPKGAALLKDNRSFTLTHTDGSRYVVGAGSKSRVLKTTDSLLEIEKDEGRGKLVLSVSYARLTFDCSVALARLGLADEGEDQLAWALMKALSPDAEMTVDLLGKVLAEAQAGKAPASGLARLRAWLAVLEKEDAARIAFANLEGLIEQKKLDDAQKAVDAFWKDYAGTAFRAQREADRAALEEKLKALKLENGLWVSYWSGGETNRFETFHMARAETRLMLDWGDGQCDPQVPGDNFGLRIGGFLDIPAAGRYGFYMHSDDLMRVWLDGNLISETGCNEQKPELDLQPGLHTFKVEFMEYHGGASLHIRWKPPNAPDYQDIPAELLKHKPAERDLYQKP